MPQSAEERIESQKPTAAGDFVDWKRIARIALTSRLMDTIEETRLGPKGKVPYQFSARGHEVCQPILGTLLTHPKDGISVYYRSRPLLLALGVSIEDALAAPMAKSGAYNDGRDVGVVANLPSMGGPTVLPMAGDVGAQFTPAAGWAQAIRYRKRMLEEDACQGAIAVVLGGEGSVATNGFWSSLTIATTLKLPLLFYIEDNGYAISVPGELQTPGSDIGRNLSSFADLEIYQADGCQTDDSAQAIRQAVDHVRSWRGPALIRLVVPRLCGHSGQDTQAYKGAQRIEEEKERDPLDALQRFLVPETVSRREWETMERAVQEEVEAAVEAALGRSEPDPRSAARFVFAEADAAGRPLTQRQGGLAAEGHRFPESSDIPDSEPTRINMLTAIRRTLQTELESNPKLLIFGEDVGPKGGVHAATMGLQKTYGEDRVFDTSLSEEGIIGRAVGMAAAGLMPVAEIQFRKYADPATEQLNNCGTIRWRTANRFAAPIVVRMPGGFFKCGDPWHSVSGEVLWAHAIGWQVCVPSNAEDAVGLLRTALRSNNPTIFFEHRHLLDTASARRPYPGDRYALPMGKARRVLSGEDLTVVTWAAMVERCRAAAEESGRSVEVLDLRTIVPWDKEAVLESVRRTHRCLIVHEDNQTAGFGAEIAAVVAHEVFLELDAPVQRLTTPDVPIPYNVGLMNAILPSVEGIAEKIVELVEF